MTRLFPGQDHVLLDGARATRDAVRAALARHAWTHIACHGSQDLMAPFRAGLHLHDGLLTVAKLATTRPEESGELIYPSACQTAMGGARVPDEAITLAHALQFTGYRQVVATLWSVEDAVAMQAAEDFYTRLGTHRPTVPGACRGGRVRPDRRLRLAGPAGEFGVSPATAHRRFTVWTNAGLWRRLHRVVLTSRRPRRADWASVIVDAASVRAKGRLAVRLATPHGPVRGQGTSPSPAALTCFKKLLRNLTREMSSHSPASARSRRRPTGLVSR